MERARSGDPSAFGELYDTYAPLLYRRVLLPRLANEQAAEDALSETFRTAMERLDRFELRKVSIYHWLSRIAHNKAMDMHRARAVTGRRLNDLQGMLSPLLVPQDAADELLELVTEASEIKSLVRRTLEALNPRYRRAIELRFFEERTREDCARSLNVKLGTFDVVLLRALRAFRGAWDETLKDRKESGIAGSIDTAAFSGS